MKKIFHAILLIFIFTCSAYAADDHVIINQVLGGKDGSCISHSFIELYNPTDSEVDLSSYAIHFKSSKEDDTWHKLDLTGKIPAKSSYLIRAQAHTGEKITYQIENFDQDLIQELGGGYRTL